MLSDIYAECHLCWVSFMLSVIYAECHSCWESFMLSVIYVVKTSLSFYIDFQETLTFNPTSFANMPDLIKQANNALRTIQYFSFPLSIQDSLSKCDFQKCVCQHYTLECRCKIWTALSLNVLSCKTRQLILPTKTDYKSQCSPQKSSEFRGLRP